MDSILFSGGSQRHVASQAWQAEIIAGGYRAVIFDCDGTLVDSGRAHFASLRAAARAQGQDVEYDWYAQRGGLDRQSLLAQVASNSPGAFDVALAARHSIDAFINAATQGTAAGLSPIADTNALVRSLAGAYPMAVGTNAETDVATASLRAVGLLDYFVSIVSISQGLPPKPAPDIFAQAAQTLGFAASRTLVFEDAPEGVSAALAAGSDVIQLVHS